MKKRLQRILAQGRFLDEIMAWKRQQLPELMAETPEPHLQALLAFTPPPVDWVTALARPGVSLIAEIKRATPDKGLIAREFELLPLAETCAAGGAAALLYATDARFYQGHLQHLTAIKEHFRQQDVALPVLRHDFIFHPWQLLQSRVAGADGVILHMALLGDADYAHLLAYARELGMEPLVQVHDEQELTRALKARPRIISLSNRNLRNFALDTDVIPRLRPQIPADVLVVAGGGIRNAADVAALQMAGVQGVRIGESLMRQSAKQRLRKLRNLARAGQEI